MFFYWMIIASYFDVIAWVHTARKFYYPSLHNNNLIKQSESPIVEVINTIIEQ